MPLLVKDYTWTQTETTVYISIPLKGVNPRKVDIFSTDEYLKVHFPPFLFEGFLYGSVDDNRSVAKLGDGVAIFTLQKNNDGFWKQLTLTNYDKETQREIRERAILKVQEKAVAVSKANAMKQQEEKKYALEKMMKLEEEERANIQRIKGEECERATAELEAWKLKQRHLAEEKEIQQRQQNATPERGPAYQHKMLEKNPVQKSSNHRVLSASPSGTTGGATVCARKMKQVEVPAPRSTGCIKVSFTPRVFPTALRESRVPEEEEWLRKQAEARRLVSEDLAELDDLKEEERNPDWLKDKGDKFFKTGNYLAAVNAYSLAIKLNRKIPALFSNRAASHLKLRNLHKTIEDCSQALALLTPAVPDNAAARMKAHVRRGTAFCELELYVEGLQDYQAALKIDPFNKILQADTERIREVIQGTVS